MLSVKFGQLEKIKNISAKKNNNPKEIIKFFLIFQKLIHFF